MIERGSRAGAAIRATRGEPGANGPGLLYVHGLGESSACFEGLLEHPRLASIKQLALDLPGYGVSPRLPEPRSLERHARFLGRFLESEIHRPVILVGHSMGGVIGQLLCAPDTGARPLLAGFVNVEGNLSPGDCTGSAVAASQEQSHFVARGFECLVESTEEEGQTEPAKKGYARSMRLCDPAQFHLNSVELVEVSNGETLAEKMARLGLPAIYIGGRPGGVARRSLELLERANVDTVVLKPSGHWPYIDQREAFVEELLGFAKRVASSS